MSIDRFNIEHYSSKREVWQEAKPDPEGTCVLYADHAAIVAELEEKLRKAEQAATKDQPTTKIE